MAEKGNKKKAGDWAAETFPGGVNANLTGIMDLLTNLGGKSASAKVLEGTDQNGKPICAVFWLNS